MNQNGVVWRFDNGQSSVTARLRQTFAFKEALPSQFIIGFQNVIVRSHRIWRKVAAYAFVVAVLPLTFVLVLFIWREIDRYQARHEVAEFVVRHSKVVQHRLTDPRVHSFSLSHDLNDPSTLLINFDVEDKATYHMLEDDLANWVQLKNLPVWNTTLRSDEDQGNDYGVMGAGIGAVMEGLMQLGVAAIVSFCTFLVALTVLRVIHAPDEKNGKANKSVDRSLRPLLPTSQGNSRQHR